MASFWLTNGVINHLITGIPSSRWVLVSMTFWMFTWIFDIWIHLFPSTISTQSPSGFVANCFLLNQTFPGQFFFLKQKKGSKNWKKPKKQQFSHPPPPQKKKKNKKTSTTTVDLRIFLWEPSWEPFTARKQPRSYNWAWIPSERSKSWLGYIGMKSSWPNYIGWFSRL